MITKEDVIRSYKSELALTAKVLRAIPEGQLDYKPHEKSGTIKDLLRTFIVVLIMDMDFLKGIQSDDAMKKVPEFDFVAEGVGTFETKSQEFMTALEAISDEEIQQAFTIWGMESTRAQMIMMLLNDMIHHRGQLSVYIRLAGGLVPSIYGPSADDKGGF